MAKRRRLSRKFKGVWIPRRLWFARDLSPVERCLLAEIHSLSDRDEGCDRSDGEFADFFQISKRSVSRGIAKLKDLRLINVVVDKQGGNERTIFMVEGAIDNLAIGGTDKMAVGVQTKWQEPTDKMAVHNIEENTVDNTGGENTVQTPAPRDPAEKKQKKSPEPETKAGRAWENAREVLEDELHFPDRFLEFFDMEVMGRWNKFEVTVVVVKDWHRQLYIKFDIEMLAGVLSDYKGRHKGWQPNLADVVKLASAMVRSREAAAQQERKELEVQEKDDKPTEPVITFRQQIMSMTGFQVMARFHAGNTFERTLIKEYRPDVFGKKEAKA